ncbi:MAG: class I SAM-dependent methyltransferase [Chloroflexota bacterium]
MEPGLDYAFLKFIDVTPETQRPIRQFYVPLFEGCKTVVDLGCGTGDFIALLRETGIDAIGVDADPLVSEQLKQQSLPIIEQDVLSYLETVEANSLDGIYSAHLVEHLPYEQVLRLIKLSYQALKPGGRLILATPNPQALVSHLEFYHMHFGHEAFYHPQLLHFFLDYCGYTNIETGDNPQTTAWSLDNLYIDQGQRPPIHYQRGFQPLPSANIINKLSRALKNIVFRFVVQPFLDDMETQLNRVLLAHHTAIQTTGVSRAFECYALGYKPSIETPENVVP